MYISHSHQFSTVRIIIIALSVISTRHSTYQRINESNNNIISVGKKFPIKRRCDQQKIICLINLSHASL